MNGNDRFKSETLLSVKMSFQIILFVFSVVVFLSLITAGVLFGAAGRAIYAFILGVLGHSAYPLFVAVLFFTIKIFAGKKFTIKNKSVICSFILFFTAGLCYHLFTSREILSLSQSYSEYIEKCFEAGNSGVGGATGGGLLFGLVVYPVKALFETTGSYIIYGLIFAFTALILFNGKGKREITEVKEYPSDYFNNVQPLQKEYTLPQFQQPQYIPQQAVLPQGVPQVNPQQVLGQQVPMSAETQPASKANKKDDIVTVPKKLFVGYIDDFVSTKAKKTKSSSKSYDILYSNKPKISEEDIYPQSSGVANTLGGTSYTETFGDDFESKKKYILTPIDNILKPGNDYGTGRIFPLSRQKEENKTVEKPPRINHNMSSGSNLYQKYANEPEIPITDNTQKTSALKAENHDYLENLSSLMERYNRTANEKSTFLTGGDMQQNIDSDRKVHPENEQDKNLNEGSGNNPVDLGFGQNEGSLGFGQNEDSGDYRHNIEDIYGNAIKINRPSGGDKPQSKQENPLKYQTEIAMKKDTPVIRSPYVAPPTALMNDIIFDPAENAENYQEKVTALENTLEEFKVPAKVVSVTPGPTVTRYELQMPPGIPVSKLTSRANDIAMCLASNGEIRIEAPIPGKSLLGIELPNKKRQKVGLKEVIDSPEFINSKSFVAFALGKEISGKNVIVDFTKIPHLLVAGSTGSGKSVCLNTLIISILYKASPEDVRLILIDPKRVEFNVYNGLPHLMLKDVITDAEKAISAFNWAINEMDRRFELFKETMSKDIIAYNEKIKQSGGVKLPRILIIVDELAELMMINKRELEEKIKKISQLSRAAGIHLILATQRPSVDIITGVIKANLSSRVTFKLMTQADSRTVLDCSGAEKLLGEGDMIFISNNMPKPVRLQGPFISMSEVEAIVDFVKSNNEAYYDDEIEQKIMNSPSENEESDEEEQSGEMDKFFVDALRLAIDAGQISISMVQRRFAVGYSRAGKIIDEMEKQKYISAFEGSKPRQVLITREEFERKFGTGS
jgi:DNA segregation ATPase FtsK/SpoIIIE-like protein